VVFESGQLPKDVQELVLLQRPVAAICRLQKEPVHAALCFEAELQYRASEKVNIFRVPRACTQSSAFRDYTELLSFRTCSKQLLAERRYKGFKFGLRIPPGRQEKFRVGVPNTSRKKASKEEIGCF
jgi:hypothetical protein